MSTTQTPIAMTAKPREPMSIETIQKILTVISLGLAVIFLTASTYMFIFEKTKGMMSTLKAAFVPLVLLINGFLSAAIVIVNLKMNPPDETESTPTASPLNS